MKHPIIKGHYLNQRAFVIWITGLSGSGKSTLAVHLQKEFAKMNYISQVLDGDIIRSGLNRDLSYSNEDRIENIRRIAEISKLFFNCGIVCINSFICPTNHIREVSRLIIGRENINEIHMSASLSHCEKMDIKGLYKKARKGILKDFTGIDAPYEIPENTDIEINSEFLTIEESVQKSMSIIKERLLKDSL